MPSHSIFVNHMGGLLFTTLTAFLTGGGAVRLMLYISKAMPKLPPNAGWWTQFLYAIVKGASGLDPSATIVVASTKNQTENR
jgi:hypothetical protein